jgi:C1A family cysteine protease
MKMRLTLITVLTFLLSLTSVVCAQEDSAKSLEALNASIMRPDAATRDTWYQEFLNAPKAHIDPVIQKRLLSKTMATKPLPILLDHITYTPTERNQSSCGNCWVWAGTGLMETIHSVERGVKDRLSVQYFDSAFYAAPGGYYACNGGNLGTFVNFYNSHSFIPWSNTNAHFQDQAGGSAPKVAASSISTDPRYEGNPNSLKATTISTTNVTQATAIANIKNVLSQNKAVQFNFWLATSADWSSFFSFWNSQPETAIWNPDSFCGHTVNSGEGGHAVVVVGYDDTDADTAKHYWIVLNSWGAPANRPNGLFRMKMYMNYKCTNVTSTGYYYNRQFQTIETVAGTTPFFDTNSLFMAAKGASTNNVWFREKSTGQPWSIWSMLDGTTGETPAMATFNTRQYMVTKGAADTTLWIRNLRSTGVWSAWSAVSGTTDAAPALTTYRNRLYLFAKSAGSSSIQYKSMGTNGAWSAWQTVAGSSTPYAPSVVVHNDQLHLFQTDGSGRVLIKSMQSDGTWGGWGGLTWGEFRSNAGPSAAIFDNRIHIVAKGIAGTPNSNKISLAASAPGGGWYTWSEIPGGGLTSRGPRVGTGPDLKTLNVIVTGQGNNTLWTQTYVKGTGWNSGWTRIPGYSTAAPSLNTYWFRAEPFPMSPLENAEGNVVH